MIFNETIHLQLDIKIIYWELWKRKSLDKTWILEKNMRIQIYDLWFLSEL